eukprot:TRINITY_DN16478_c0_g1_i5.p1 TRINITY_DN16478_c0_g1~~TRINITY_DN16478_c0_g1_i5.p1  ORF type:complete len:1416 (+),score=374.56 TRINITY_DN16478_c0_g1_i5:252-4499(+)
MNDAFKEKMSRDEAAIEKTGQSGCWWCDVVRVSDDGEEITLQVKDQDPFGNNYPRAMVGKQMEFPNTDEKIRALGGGYACNFDASFPQEGIAQMTSIKYLNEAELSRNLQQYMCVNRKTYCLCADTLVAINPFTRTIPNYTPQVLSGVIDGSIEEPHIYVTSKQLLTRAMTGNPQTLLITGESGAGKTFNTRKVIEYLATVGKPDNVAEGQKLVTDRMLESGGILDAFGNSTMPRNNDSSRFGKLYQIFFTPGGTISGCAIQPYLLEKSRVVHQSSGERCFHVFYMLVFGAKAVLPPSEYEELGLLAPTSYAFLNRAISPEDLEKPGTVNGEDSEAWYAKRSRTTAGGSWMDNEQKNDAIRFLNEDLYDDGEDEPIRFANLLRDLRSAFNPTGADDQADVANGLVAQILRTLSAILLMGQIVFREGRNDSSEVGNEDVTQKIATLLDVDHEILKEVLSTKYAGKYAVPLNPEKSRANSRAVACTLYDHLFQWVVGLVSDGLKEASNPNDPNRMGVLDIFGFEFTPMDDLEPPTKMNSFEQFCINLCNEQLQNKYQNDILEVETKTYKDELGIPFTPPFPDNEAVIQVCYRGSRGQNIQKVLEEATKGRSGDKSGKDFDIQFTDKMLKTLKDTEVKIRQSNGKKENFTANPKLIEKPSQKMADGKPDGYYKKIKRSSDRDAVHRCFKMQHYAGEVYYDTLEWTQKNNATLADKVNTMLEASNTPFPGRYWSSKNGAGHATIMESFTSDLVNLKDHLDKDNRCTFVRCIKSNTFKAPMIFQGYLVLNQLRYTGMMDALRIRKLGWPFRMPQNADHGVYDWMDRYGRLYPLKTGDSTPKEFVEWLKDEGGTHDTQQMYQQSLALEENQDYPLVMVGKTLVFMKDHITLKMDAAVDKILEESCLIVQSAFRMAVHQDAYSLQRKCAAQLQPVLDGVIARKAFMKRYEEIYERQDRHDVQEMIQGTTYRQQYYERKRHYSQMQANIAKLSEALEKSVLASHESFVANMEAEALKKESELDMRVKELKNQIAAAKAGNNDLLDQEKQKLKELEARLNKRRSEVDQARDQREKVRSENAESMSSMNQAYDKKDRELRDQNRKARNELDELQKTVPELQRKKEARVMEYEAAHSELLKEQKEEQEALAAKRDAVTKQIGATEESQLDLKAKAQAEADAGEKMLKDLDREERDLEAEHALEVTELAERLRVQNWKLLRLHMSEQQTAAEFEHLGLALPSADHNDSHAQANEVDVLDTQITVLKNKMKQSQQSCDAIKARLDQLEAEKAEAQAAWDQAKNEQNLSILRLEEALDRESKVSHKLEEACQQPGPPRSSRFDVSHGAKPSAPAPAPAPPAAVGNSTHGSRFHSETVQHTATKQQMEAAGKKQGLTSLSALYKGRGTVNVSQLEKLDSATLSAALRLLH